MIVAPCPQAFRASARRFRRPVVRSLLCFAVVAMGFGAAPAPVTASPDEAGGPSSSTSTYTATLDAMKTSWYSLPFTIGVDSVVDTTLSWSESADLNLFVRDEGQTPIAETTSWTANPEEVKDLALPAGNYRLGVKAASGAASFTLSLSQKPAWAGDVQSWLPSLEAMLEGGLTERISVEQGLEAARSPFCQHDL